MAGFPKATILVVGDRPASFLALREALERPGPRAFVPIDQRQ